MLELCRCPNIYGPDYLKKKCNAENIKGAFAVFMSQVVYDVWYMIPYRQHRMSMLSMI